MNSLKNGHSRMEILEIITEKGEVDQIKSEYKRKIQEMDESSDEYSDLMDRIFELKARSNYLDHKYAHVNNIFADPKNPISFFTPKESPLPDFKFECQVCGGSGSTTKSTTKPTPKIPSAPKTEKQLKEEADEWTSHIPQTNKKSTSTKGKGKGKGKK